MKNVIGVAAEYNPFHLGHALQLEKSREKLEGLKPRAGTESEAKTVPGNTPSSWLLE